MRSFQPRMVVSLRVEKAAGPVDPMLDVGAEASLLADHLLASGCADVTLLDLSAAALEEVRKRLAARDVLSVLADLLAWEPPRTQALRDWAVCSHEQHRGEDGITHPADQPGGDEGGALIGATAVRQDCPRHCAARQRTKLVLPVARSWANGATGSGSCRAVTC